jgi:hypothetical protein
MDGTRFDQLIKSLATQRVSRLTALRGLAAGAVASVTGLSLFGEEGEAKKGKKTRKRRICHRTSASDPGVSKKLKAKKAKKHLRNHQFDTKGRCGAAPAPAPTTGAPPNPGTQCAVDQDCSGGLVCRGGRCDLCNNNNECPGDQLCIQGQCRGGPSDFLGDCEDTPQNCPFPLACIETDAGGAFFCFLPVQSYGEDCPPVDDANPTCPQNLNMNASIDTQCILGSCVFFCDDDEAEDYCEDTLLGQCIGNPSICIDPV